MRPSTGLSIWTMPVLRAGMGIFIVLWGFDKIFAAEDAGRIFAHFYRLEIGATFLIVFGVLEIGLGLLLAAGILKKPVAWIILAVNSVSTFASWKQIIDPWGRLGLTDGGAHLFLASIVIMAVSIVLVLNANDTQVDPAGRAAV